MDQTSLMKWIRWLNKEKKAESIWKMNDSFLPTGNRAKNLMISVYSKVSNRVFNFKKTTLFLPSYFGSSHTPFSQRSSCNSIESTSCSTTVSDRWDGREWERSYLTVPLTLRWDPSDPRILGSQRMCMQQQGRGIPGSFQIIPENHQWNIDHKIVQRGPSVWRAFSTYV